MAEPHSSAGIYLGPGASSLDGGQFLLSENLACLRNDSNVFNIETQHKHRMNRRKLLRTVRIMNFGSVSKAESCGLFGADYTISSSFYRLLNNLPRP